MKTEFSLAQLADPAIAEADKILRACVHCGFCTATCPTYVLLGDELDSPRGRIYLIKDMLENDRPATQAVVKHIDRCLSCLSCMTTCPSGVHYMHLVDQARGVIMSVTGEPGGPPVKAGVPLTDLGAALFTLVGILAALEARHRTVCQRRRSAGHRLAARRQPSRLRVRRRHLAREAHDAHGAVGSEARRSCRVLPGGVPRCRTRAYPAHTLTLCQILHMSRNTISTSTT